MREITTNNSFHSITELGGPLQFFPMLKNKRKLHIAYRFVAKDFSINLGVLT
jgi:hypothetical protein